MIESKKFAGGGLNKDVEESFLKPNEYDDALNIRVTDRLNNEDGVVTNVKGNTEVVFNGLFGSGSTNKCIGNFANEQTGKYYSFIWNSAGYHTITEFDPFANTITKVLQSRTDTSGVDILNFREYDLINGVNIVDADLLYWTDGFNPPRGIQISKAKTGNYYLTRESISLIKPPPQRLITSYYESSSFPAPQANKLKGQLFQFKYLYVYEDGSRSAWSSSGTMPVPINEGNPINDTNPYNYNKIVLSFDVGTKYVKSIELAALVKGTTNAGGTNDWYSILNVSRSEAMSSAYSYNSGTNLATFEFFNDGLYEPLDVAESDLPYDFVPLKSKTLEVVNGNVLVLGNNTEGYDNIATNVDLSLTYQAGESQRMSIPDSDAPFTFTGYPSVGDQITFTFINFDGITVPITYTVPNGPLDLPSVLDNFGNYIDGFYGNTNITYSGPPYELNPPTDPETWSIAIGIVGGTFVSNVVTLAPVASPRSTPAYKTNSKYQMGLVYYDEFNRSSYVQTSTDFIISTKTWGQTQGQSPVVNWQISHSAPSWATKYQWVRTEQLTHQKFLFWAASSVTVDATSNYFILNINSLNQYTTDNPEAGPVINYDYSPGDRCTIHRNGSNWINAFDVQVASYNPANGQLKIQRPPGYILQNTTTIIEVYTPKTRANNPQEQFFYEFGEQYSCSGGVHSTTAGSFESGDIYTRTRTISATGYFLEDPNFSDFYISNYSSNGRTNVYAPQAKQLNLPTDIRYSDTYVPNTNINGLSRFYGNAFETYDRVNGSIQKLAVRDNYLMTFQELKTGYIPLEQSIIEDQGGGNPNVAISTKLLNKIRYFYGDYGIGLNPESFARFAGTLYFADPNRGLVLKITDSIRPISYIGMDSYFTTKLSSIRSFPNAKILGSYDPYNDEYIIAFKLASISNPSLDETVAFSEAINRWTTFYSYKPDIGGYIFNQYITHKDARLYKHDTNSTYNRFYGVNHSSTISTSFNVNSAMIKTYIGVMTQSSSAWIPTSISTSLGQSSSLIASDFSFKEGVYFASFLKDSSSPGGLLNGDDLKGYWIKLGMTNTETSKSTMLGADVRFINSFQGIK